MKKKTLTVWAQVILVIGLLIPYNNCSPIGDISDGLSTSSTALSADSFSGSLKGELIEVSATGNVVGWAKDPYNPGAPLNIYLYANAPYPMGNFIGTTLANQKGGGSGYGHFFSHQLGRRQADGNSRQLYLYAVDPSLGALVGNRPHNFTAVAPVAETFYDETVAPAIQTSCSGCHSFRYMDLYGFLIEPNPFDGGSALNNRLINKISGNSSHGGGNVCGDKSNSPCLQLQKWWDAEFN